MEIQLLREQEIFPSKEILRDRLGKVYEILEELEMQLSQNEFNMMFDWQYYKDSKGWLCKVCYKKKTVFWLSVWEGFFKASFFFLERHLEGIASLNLHEDSYIVEKEWGKMIPLIFSINNQKQLPDLLKMIDFKKKSK
jgi:hypothetical protein